MNSHLTPQEMLSYLDGELSRSEGHKAEKHLHSCWSCRSEVERLKADIATILDAQNQSFSPILPPPPKPWLSFNKLLVGNLPGRPASLWMCVGMRVQALFGPAQVFMTLSAAAILLVFIHSMLRSKPVFAREVLQRVETADIRRTTITRDQVIRERVHVRKRARGHADLQSASLDTWKSPSTAYWNMPDHDSVAADLRAQYSAHNVPIALPLSVASVDCWKKIAGGSPTVSQQGADIALTFPGSRDDSVGSVKRVSLLIQPETWQVRQMTLEFSGASFEVTEDEFSVIPLSGVPPDLLAHLEPQLPPKMMVGSLTTLLPARGNSAVDVAMLNAFVILHHLNADLGEPVTVTRSSKEVVVGLWQLPAERKKDIFAAFKGEPKIKVEYVEPRQRGAIRTTSPAKVMKANATLYVAADSSDNDQRLLRAFATPNEEQEFTRQVLLASTVILSHLYALRNLQEQFSPEKEQFLMHEDQTRLAALVRDHAFSVEANLENLRAQFAPLNAAFHVSSHEPSQEPIAAIWQSGSRNALETAKVTDHLLRSLLTASQTPIAPENALPEIERSLSRIQAEITTCCTHAL
jgi:hypothetical protein